MNYMLHNVGREEDFVRWEASGATGWGLRQLQPYVSRMLGTEYKCIKQNPHCLKSYQNLLMSAAGLYTTPSAHQKNHRNCVRVKVFCGNCNTHRNVQVEWLAFLLHIHEVCVHPI
jgi:hypothetical protein